MIASNFAFALVIVNNPSSRELIEDSKFGWSNDEYPLFMISITEDQDV